MLRRLLPALLLCATALATRMWTQEELDRFERTYKPHVLPRPDSLIHGPRRFNYLERVRLTCEFIKLYQVSDSQSPSFGGIIEAEHMPSVIETDNTQEAIWVWSRWYELTGRDDYATQIRRAWYYVLRHPAYREHEGNPQNIWYALWNCGLGFMAEAKYREVYADTSYRPYADTCRQFFLANPLGTGSTLDWFVTGQASGMAYDYAREQGDNLLRDSALARGVRVKTWIEAGAAQRLAYANWAMCGGTAFWGVAHTFCKSDTAAGRQWLSRYADSLPGFYPSGNWNCSHNIWLANAYRSAAELTDAEPDWLMHHYLVDTLVMKDTDLDGGIPATWTDPPTEDQTWVSTYLDFMGMDVFVTPTFDHDLSPLEFLSPSARSFYIAGETIPVIAPIANVGLADEPYVSLRVSGNGYADSLELDTLRFCATETLRFTALVTTQPGLYGLDAISSATADLNPRNDTARARFRVYGQWAVRGSLRDSATGNAIPGWVKAGIKGSQLLLDSCWADSTGQFLVTVIDSLITFRVEPGVPYFRRSWDIAIAGDTTIILSTPPAQLLVVNNDTNTTHAGYYTSSLDTLGVTWCHWSRQTAGPVPWDVCDLFLRRTIIWYSGDTLNRALLPEDRDSLAAFLGRGGSLILTGQNVAESLAGTQFLENTVGCRFDSSGWSQFYAFGDRRDSLGRMIPGTATAGGNGASNQKSRDMLSPLGNSGSFLVYDTVRNITAATRRVMPAGGRVVMLGFGFEAVNRPVSKPTYYTRVQLMNLMLNWLWGLTGISEQPPSALCSSLPTVCRDVLFLPASRLAPHSSLFSLTGQKVLRLHPGPNNLQGLPAGVYFVRAAGQSQPTTRKVVILE